jgi:hypothetical protein
MAIKRLGRTLGLISIPAVLVLAVLTSCGSAEPVGASLVYTWDCEYPEQKPEALTLTCGDGNMYLDQIQWESWSVDGAEGTGRYNVNDCDPNCADGNFLRTDVKFTLTSLTEFEGAYYLRNLEIETLSGENLPDSNSSFFQWDVMEFAESMTG